MVTIKNIKEHFDTSSSSEYEDVVMDNSWKRFMKLCTDLLPQNDFFASQERKKMYHITSEAGSIRMSPSRLYCVSNILICIFLTGEKDGQDDL